MSLCAAKASFSWLVTPNEENGACNKNGRIGANYYANEEGKGKIVNNTAA
jgi:hypothetical protein